MAAYTASTTGKLLCVKRVVLLWTVNWLSEKPSGPGVSNDGTNRYFL